MDYPNCMMGGCDTADSAGRACARCGFDRDEAERRLWVLRRNGLTRSVRTGRYRLLLRRSSPTRRDAR